MAKHPSSRRYRQIAEHAAGRKLGSDEVVHHRDEDHANESPANLVVEARAEHSAHHARTQNTLGRLHSALRMTREKRKLY